MARCSFVCVLYVTHGGKESDQVHRSLERDIAKQLLELYFPTTRDVCTTNIFFYTSQPRTTVITKKFYFFRNDKKTPSRSVQVIQQKDGNIFYKFILNYADGVCLVANQAKNITYHFTGFQL